MQVLLSRRWQGGETESGVVVVVLWEQVFIRHSLFGTDSLGGNSKTVMVANIGPAGYNYDETLTTLR